jgi:hypothetical protein
MMLLAPILRDRHRAVSVNIRVFQSQSQALRLQRQGRAGDTSIVQ